MAVYAFSLESMVRGYHEYKSLWTNPFDGEVLLWEREIGNPCDPQAVAVKKEIDHVLQVVKTYIVDLFHFYQTRWDYQLYNNWRSA